MWSNFRAGKAVPLSHSFLCALLLVLFSAVLLFAQAQTSPPDNRTVLLLTIKDAISPASSDYFYRGLERAREVAAEVVVLQLDTPGGLDLAMREIIQDMIASAVPVIVYVAPSGARAASAGTYMLYAAHVAAMAPGTNLGAATPVQLGGGGFPDFKPPAAPTPGDKSDKNSTPQGGQDKDDAAKPSAANPGESAMGKKVINDAIAYIRSLAEMRGRNVEWAELAVREAASLSSDEALSKGVIDLVASDINDLLRQSNGREVSVQGVTRSLATEGLVVERFTADWRNRLLSVISNPNVAYILMMIGMYGLFFEFVNPGFVLPGVMGAICLLLALYALQILPVNYAGLGLIILGIMFMVGEAFVPSFGVLGLGGLVAFVIGSVILFDTRGGGMQISYPLIGVVSAVTGGFILIVMRLAYASIRKPVVSGLESLLGSTGEAAESFQQRGRVLVQGEMWHAQSSRPLQRGDKVKVIAIDGLTLTIEPLEEAA